MLKKLLKQLKVVHKGRYSQRDLAEVLLDFYEVGDSVKTDVLAAIDKRARRRVRNKKGEGRR